MFGGASLVAESGLQPLGCNPDTDTYEYLKGKVMGYVNNFKYLGHWINSKFTDDEDIRREIRFLSVRGNILPRESGFCNVDVERCLFKTLF